MIYLHNKVPLLNEYSFYERAHFNSRTDEIDLKVAKILSSTELQELNWKYGF
jgi:hypothetical protein